MELNNISFVEGKGEALPSKITVTMTLDEAIWIAKIAGKQNGTSPHDGIYHCLVGDVFNRYWDEGVKGADVNNVTIPIITNHPIA